MKQPEHIILGNIQADDASYAGKSIAVHLHLFYEDLAEEYVQYLANIPVAFDMYISIPQTAECDTAHIRSAFSRLPNMASLTIERTPNRGRDIAPMVCTFGQPLMQHDIMLHLHTKKSPHDSKLGGWRTFINEHLLGSQHTVACILTLLSGTTGIISPPDFSPNFKKGRWLCKQNKRFAQQLTDRAGWQFSIEKECPVVYFPQGSMFWARSAFLRPLFGLGLTYEDFPAEPIPADGTIAHAIERLFFLWGKDSGLSSACLYKETWEKNILDFLMMSHRKHRKYFKLYQYLMWFSGALIIIIALLICL